MLKHNFKRNECYSSDLKHVCLLQRSCIGNLIGKQKKAFVQYIDYPEESTEGLLHFKFIRLFFGKICRKKGFLTHFLKKNNENRTYFIESAVHSIDIQFRCYFCCFEIGFDLLKLILMNAFLQNNTNFNTINDLG